MYIFSVKNLKKVKNTQKVTSRHNIIPIEVKSGKNYTLSSLNKCVAAYSENIAPPMVLHAADYKQEAGITYLPLYMTPLP